MISTAPLACGQDPKNMTLATWLWDHFQSFQVCCNAANQSRSYGPLMRDPNLATSTTYASDEKPQKMKYR